LAGDRDQICAIGDQALHVCFISHQYPPAVIGGIGRFTADLAAGFAAAGHDVHVLTSQDGVCGATVEDGVGVHRLVSRPPVPEALRNEQAGLYLSRIGMIYREVARIHKQKPFDIVSSPIWLAEGLLIAMDRRFVSVLSLHTSSKTGLDIGGSGQSADSDPLAALEMRCVREHSHTHANSDAAVRRITAEYSAPNGVIVIPHGVNDELSRYVRTRRDDGRVRILLVGLLDKRKGADVLYDLIPEILSRFSMVEFVLAGRAYPIAELHQETLPMAIKRRLSNRPDMLKRVNFAGVVSDQELYQCYADADLLLLTSRYESFGLSVIEAMSFGLPVVAWKAGGVCETVIDGETGILVDVEDRAGLMEAVGRLATDRDLRGRYGERGRRRYLLHFSTTKSIPRTIAAYRKIVETSTTSIEAPQSFQNGALVSQFARVVEGVTTIRGAAALRVAQVLISGQPRVSAIVRCFNSAEYVVAALDSVLTQTYSNFLCVIVDDASSDDSAEIIAKWIAEKQDGRFSLVRNDRDRGQMANAAAGLAASDGEFIAFLDAEDFWFPDFLQIHVGAIYGTPIAVSCSRRVQVDRHRRTLSGTSDPVQDVRGRRDDSLTCHQDGLRESTDASGNRSGPPQATLAPAAYVDPPWGITSSMMFRRSVLNAAMPLDLDSFRIFAQEYLFMLCHSISGSCVIDQPLAACRSHNDENLPRLAVINSTAHSGSEGQYDGIVIVQAVLRQLLDYPPELASVLPARRRQILVRILVRRCLLAGVPVEDPRIYDVVGSSRILRDRLRAKIWFLRRRLV
jgi:glycosyltransferase involved in cell wall biosynthesis